MGFFWKSVLSLNHEEIAIRGDLFSMHYNNDLESFYHDFNEHHGKGYVKAKRFKWDFSSNLFRKNVTNEVTYSILCENS